MCSVPQGSCLGPVLCLIYASTIANVIPENLHIYGYADDHSLSTSFKPCHQDEYEGNQQLQGICLAAKDWMDSNRLKMEISTIGEISILRRNIKIKINRQENYANNKSNSMHIKSISPKLPSICDHVTYCPKFYDLRESNPNVSEQLSVRISSLDMTAEDKTSNTTFGLN